MFRLLKKSFDHRSRSKLKTRKNIAKLSFKEYFSKDVMKILKINKGLIVCLYHPNLYIQKKQSKKEANDFF